MKPACALLVLIAATAAAQSSRPSVLATGDGSVSVTPDQARINVSAVTQAATAQEAVSQNASVTANILAQLTTALGASGTVKTVSYSVSPTYTYPTNAAPVLTGYTVTNSMTATLNDLTVTGKIIDTATQAGATRIDSLQFTLKDDTSARSQALRAATIKAKAKADAIAASLGLKTGAVILIQEAGAVAQVLTSGVLSAAATPIQPGAVDVTGNVTIQVELLQ
jgi:uncharacterized protein YggE